MKKILEMTMGLIVVLAILFLYGCSPIIDNDLEIIPKVEQNLDDQLIENNEEDDLGIIEEEDEEDDLDIIDEEDEEDEEDDLDIIDEDDELSPIEEPNELLIDLPNINIFLHLVDFDDLQSLYNSFKDHNYTAGIMIDIIHPTISNQYHILAIKYTIEKMIEYKIDEYGFDYIRPARTIYVYENYISYELFVQLYYLAQNSDVEINFGVYFESDDNYMDNPLLPNPTPGIIYPYPIIPIYPPYAPPYMPIIRTPDLNVLLHLVNVEELQSLYESFDSCDYTGFAQVDIIHPEISNQYDDLAIEYTKEKIVEYEFDDLGFEYDRYARTIYIKNTTFTFDEFVLLYQFAQKNDVEIRISIYFESSGTFIQLEEEENTKELDILVTIRGMLPTNVNLLNITSYDEFLVFIEPLESYIQSFTSFKFIIDKYNEEYFETNNLVFYSWCGYRAQEFWISSLNFEDNKLTLNIVYVNGMYPCVVDSYRSYFVDYKKPTSSINEFKLNWIYIDKLDDITLSETPSENLQALYDSFESDFNWLYVSINFPNASYQNYDSYVNQKIIEYGINELDIKYSVDYYNIEILCQSITFDQFIKLYQIAQNTDVCVRFQLFK